MEGFDAGEVLQLESEVLQLESEEFQLLSGCE